MLLRCGIILIVLEQEKYLIPTHTSYLLRNAEFCAQILFKRFSPRERRKQVWQILCAVVPCSNLCEQDTIETLHDTHRICRTWFRRTFSKNLL